MNEIRGWMLGACFAAAACALLELLCPSGKMQKTARTVTAVFFLCAVLLPAEKALRSISLTSGGEVQTASVPAELSAQVAEQSCSTAQQSVQQLIRDLLLQHGIAPERIFVAVEADSSGAILIKSAQVWLSAEDYFHAAEIKAWVEAELGVVVECISVG